MGKNELAEHDKDGNKDGNDCTQQIPRGELLEEETDGKAEPTHCVVCGRGLKVGEEEEHALYVQNRVNIVQTMPGAGIHAEQLWRH